MILDGPLEVSWSGPGAVASIIVIPVSVYGCFTTTGDNSVSLIGK